MASKRNQKRTNSASSLIAQLRDQLCVPKMPEGWISGLELSELTQINISTLHRRMKSLGYQRKKFRVDGIRLASVWCYKIKP